MTPCFWLTLPSVCCSKLFVYTWDLNISLFLHVFSVKMHPIETFGKHIRPPSNISAFGWFQPCGTRWLTCCPNVLHMTVLRAVAQCQFLWWPIIIKLGQMLPLWTSCFFFSLSLSLSRHLWLCSCVYFCLCYHIQIPQESWRIPEGSPKDPRRIPFLLKIISWESTRRESILLNLTFGSVPTHLQKRPSGEKASEEAFPIGLGDRKVMGPSIWLPL